MPPPAKLEVQKQVDLTITETEGQPDFALASVAQTL